jgi:glycosyltransferase involved in cell wall biosynthesis
MKIALLWTFPADYIVANAQAASDLGHEVILVFQERVPYTPEVKKPDSIETLIMPSHSELVARLENFGPDVIVLPGWNFPSYTKVAFRFHKRAARVMVTDTQWRATFKQLWGRLIFLAARWRFFDWALIPGERQYQFVRKLGFPHSKIQMGSIPANMRIFSSRLDEYKNTRQFIFVGRLVEEKGVTLLLDAYRAYRQAVAHPWKLVIVGEGYLNECELEGVEFRGPLSPKEVSIEMRNSSAFVLPSTFEPWAVVIQEAAASRLPIIASDECGAVPHYLHNGLNGFRVKTNSNKALVEALVSMSELSDRQLESMSRYSWRLAQNQSQESWVFAAERIFSSELRKKR